VSDVLREQAARNDALLKKIAERDRKLARPVPVKRKRDDGVHANAFSNRSTMREGD